MKALIFRETGEPKSVLELAEIPTPPLALGEALVRVLLSPINASDLHMVRGLIYGSYRKPRELVWIFGTAIFLCLMAEAFFGYLLPWGQMSFWGAQVIVNLFSAIPFIGPDLSLWIRGDYVVSDATLNRFFSFHVIAIPLVLLGLAVAGASSAAPAATGAAFKTATIGGTTVLTNAKGFTLYSFAPDTPTTSRCYGSCAAYWPPVTGTTAAGHGLPGKVTTITRTGGAHQLTYNGHPLYTYIGDAAPGQARGNNLNLNGGLWHEVPVSR